ncbi:MAG: aminoacyl-histidine dipeptidase [Desulfobacterales bacterium]|nr:aminoacyl-histidine dipeptidase [Desulfobacterales bacterium]
MRGKTREILDIFNKISAIPRCSKHEEHISRWLQQWSSEHNFQVRKDRIGNLVINVPPSNGCENSPGIVMQNHMDMVCEKIPDSTHDFSKDPIQFVYNGQWLKADKTTLGADNGIGMAIAMALAVDNTIVHPPLELLFTVDEESGLNGAIDLEPEFIEGKILLNLDSEDEGVFTIGCAGGENTSLMLPLHFSNLPEQNKIYRLRVNGIRGGHSGIDINKHRANANKLLARALQMAYDAFNIQLISVQGGKAHNAIPRDAEALLACDPLQGSILKGMIDEFEQTLKKEYATTDRSVALSICEADESAVNHPPGLTSDNTARIIQLLLALPHGVAEMSAEMEGLVETSSNLAMVATKDNYLHIQTSQRSSVMSALAEITFKIEAIAALAGADTRHGNSYPAWQPDMKSPLLKRCKEVYKHLFNKNPIVEATHAGLECGIIGSKYEGIDMISLGPTIKNPHSPNEKLYIPSIAKVQNFLAALLTSYAQ